MARASSVRPAPTSPAMPTISPRAHRQADVVAARRAGRDRATSSTASPIGAGSLAGTDPPTSRPIIMPIRSAQIGLGDRLRRDVAAVAEHR